MRGVSFWVAELCLAAVLAGSRAEPTPGGLALPAPIVERLQAATVRVEATIGTTTRRGSGFLFRREPEGGYVASSYQVVVEPLQPLARLAGPPSGRLRRPPERSWDNTPAPPGYTSGTVRCVFRCGTKEEQSVLATIVGLDEDCDLALLKVDLKPLPEPLGPDARGAVGEALPVFVAGVPAGDVPQTAGARLPVAISRGTVAGLRKDEYGRIAVIQVAGGVCPGGPVVDAEGRLLGIAVGREAGPQGGMVIPVETLCELLDGRIASVWVKSAGINAEKGVADVFLQVRLNSALRKVGSVSVHYVRDDTLKEPLRPEPNGRWPRLPGAQTAELDVDELGLTAEGEFHFAYQDTAAVVVSFQIAHEGADGTLVYSEPGRLTVPGVRRRGAEGGDDAERGAPDRSRPVAGGPGDTTSPNPEVEGSWRPPPVTVVTPPPETAVTGRLERDSRGRRYTALTAEGVELDLGKDVPRVVACPSGKVVYAIRHDESAVAVLDPLTWKPVAEIAVPEAPTSIWADTELIAVACDKSRTVVLIDAQTHSLIAWEALSELRDYTPDTIIGRAPDGSIVSLWEPRPERIYQPRVRLLVHIVPNGTSRILLRRAEFYWATELPDGNRVVTQGPFASSFAGSPEIVSAGVPRDDPRDPWRFQEAFRSRDSPERNPWNLRQSLLPILGGDLGAAFLTADRQALVLPCLRVGASQWAGDSGADRLDESSDERYGVCAGGADGRVPWTYLVSPALDRALRGFPGSAVAELPAQRLFVTVGSIWVAVQAATAAAGRAPAGGAARPSGNLSVSPRARPGWECRAACFYVSSQDGRVVREITLDWPKRKDGRPSAPVPVGAYPRAVFVPGHELLLLPNPADFGEKPQQLVGGMLTYTVFRCGPIAADAGAEPESVTPASQPPTAGTAPDRLTPTQQPPAVVTAGEEVRYTPALAPGTAPSEFRLRLPPPGMTIDPTTGAIAWRPGRVHVGRWSITILATVGGNEDTLVSWSLEVR